MSLFYTDVVKKGPRLAKPFLFPHTYSNTAISIISIEYNLDGHHLNFSSGAVSSSCAILAAHDLISSGRASLVFAGGYEAFNEIMFSAYDQAGQLSPGDGTDEVCAPFDSRRNGFILGEGAGILVLEELEHAADRNARIYGEIVSAGAGSDSSVGKAGGGQGMADVMTMALRNAAIETADIDCVSANANGSVILDGNEAVALQHVLGEQAGDIPVTSIKSITGETVGASGALQMIAGLGSIEARKIPPAANLMTPDDGVELDLVSSVGREKEIDKLLMNSIDPGGSMVAFVLSGNVG
jgi:3-oxoacyl-[acyl-carrier-protein] synthase II